MFSNARQTAPFNHQSKPCNVDPILQSGNLLLIPEFCPGGQRLTCGPTLSTNQMRPWDWLGAPDFLHVPMQPGNQHQLLLSSALLARRQ